MAIVTINDEHLTNIAGAIREKNGTQDTYKPMDMAAAISAIQAGGGSRGVTEITYNAYGGRTMSPNNYFPIDVSEATTVSFKYDYNNYISDTYASPCDFRAYIGYGLTLKDGKYIYTTVDSSNKTQNILSSQKAAVSGASVTLDVTNYTTICFWIWFSDTSNSSAMGSLRIYDIEVK